MNPTSIFSENLLSHYTPDFRLSCVTDIRGITVLVKGLIDELESGKIDNAKEEELKPRFINTFFGDILGFNYGNPSKWQLRDEKKSVVDATKSDAVLGYFFVDSSRDDVRAVIEIKDAKTKLDEKQKNRSDKQTPIEQAFGYAPKTGGKCKWVIVSNIKETRFYSSNDMAKYQVFFLKDLAKEHKLKELLFLFHKDRFIKEFENSATEKLYVYSKTIQPKDDKPLHIIDKIYNSLKRFEGFGFVYPAFLATITPFNILDNHVWHYYQGNLFTLNGEIYSLLIELTIQKDEVFFSEKLQKELLSFNVIDAKFKIEWSFIFLNHSLINDLTAIKDYQQIAEKKQKTIGFCHRNLFPYNEGEGIKLDIKIINNKICDCVSCNYRSLDFNKLLRKLKASEGDENFNTSEYAYGNYIVASNNFKTSYKIYKSIEKETKNKQDKGVDYFLAKRNIQLLHNLALDYEFEDGKEIMRDIKSVDLDRVIYDEIEFDVDKEVKKYLIDVKEDVLVYKLQDEIEEIFAEIEGLKIFIDKGGVRYAGPNLNSKLLHNYFLLYVHINKNYIIYDVFARYKKLTEKVFRGLVISYQIPDWGIVAFNDFILTEAILHIAPKSLQEILKDENLIHVIDEGIEKLLEKLKSFTTSVYIDGLFNDPIENTLITEQLYNHRFKDKFSDIFTNLFTVLSKLEITKNDFSKCVTSLVKFLKIEKELSWYNLKEFSNFILKKGNLFEANELYEILEIVVERDSLNHNKYEDLIEKVPLALAKFHSKFKIASTRLLQTAILNCISENEIHTCFNRLVSWIKPCNNECRKILVETLERHLDRSFSQELYELMILNADYDYSLKNYFQTFTERINHRNRACKSNFLKLTDLTFSNYTFVIYKLNIEFYRSELKLLTGLNDFETWILNPVDFEKEKFEANWIIDLNDPVYIYRLKQFKYIGKAIERKLRTEFNPVLAEIYYKYFLGGN